MQRFGTSIEVAKTGKIETKVVPGGGLMVTDDGLMIDVEQVGEKNRSPINRIQEPASNATLATAVATLRSSVIELLDELRRTGNMRG
jgi:hypothetical protein